MGKNRRKLGKGTPGVHALPDSAVASIEEGMLSLSFESRKGRQWATSLPPQPDGVWLRLDERGLAMVARDNMRFAWWSDSNHAFSPALEIHVSMNVLGRAIWRKEPGIGPDMDSGSVSFAGKSPCAKTEEFVEYLDSFPTGGSVWTAEADAGELRLAVEALDDVTKIQRREPEVDIRACLGKLELSTFGNTGSNSFVLERSSCSLDASDDRYARARLRDLADMARTFKGSRARMKMSSKFVWNSLRSAKRGQALAFVAKTVS